MFLRVVRREEIRGILQHFYLFILKRLHMSCLSDIIETLLEIRNYKNAPQMLILSS